ncbi:MAG TPA: hypothetical protein PK468_17665 [Candidatus Hydrogenedentes bacterium]|nr:hypothetical protein [Candidatus Hydrogenedentota bacterium]
MTSIGKYTLLPLLVLVIAAAIGSWKLKQSVIVPEALKVATAETRMWEAYSRCDINAVAREMVLLLREQFGLDESEAQETAGCIARAMGAFVLMTGSDYEKTVLPELEKGYARIKQASGALWDVQAAAQAELDWWVARRTPGQNSVEQVGQRIAKLYGVLFGTTNAHVERAGYLRAKAAWLQDSSPNWPQIQLLLEESYASLAEGVRKTESFKAKKPIGR